MKHKRVTGIVYRVENANGLGPYTDLGSSHWSASNHNYCDLHPSPMEEGLWTMTHNHKCCFETLAKLEEWFTPCELDCLINEYDFMIVRYLVDPYLAEIEYGYRQCIAKLNEDTIVDKHIIQEKIEET